jgi:hypothetical protein
MRGGKLRFLRFGGSNLAFYFKLQIAKHLVPPRKPNHIEIHAGKTVLAPFT